MVEKVEVLVIAVGDIVVENLVESLDGSLWKMFLRICTPIKKY